MKESNAIVVKFQSLLLFYIHDNATYYTSELNFII